VAQFWANAEKTTGDQGIANYVPYITNKFDVFLANEIMRPIISQEKSSFNFREIMDNKKILLVNLSKGRLGDMNANLIGLILVGKILMAALSRADIIGREEFPPFYLYIDEFHNITSGSIATILSEARKYKLSMTVANQYVKQIDEKIRDAVFGNVGSIAVFRVSSEDAEFFVKQFEPVFTTKDIMNVDNLNAYLKILSQGKPVRPFSIFEPFPPKGDIAIGDKLKQLSYLTYGQDRSFVEDSIMEKYNQAV
jgi:tRNA isopentenyl-2-thiomethyl-A-37 hydroxylase MiaE